jgi:hypothetical protein
MSIQINTVQTKQDWQEFLKLPWQIYKNNPYWVPPILTEVRESLDIKKNPFWEHAQREVFLAKNGTKIVGRIVAIVDHNHNEVHQEKTGFFGFFECVEDFEVAKSMWDEAQKWIISKKMTLMRGPASPSLNDECAFLLEGFDKSPTAMMAYSLPYYLTFSEQYGLHKAKDLYAFIVKAEFGIPERIQRMIDVIKKRTGVKIRPLDMKYFDRDIQYLKDIYNSAWEKNWGFVPMTEKEMDLTAKKLKQFVEPELILFAEIDEKTIGVSVTIPDINQILKRINGKLGPLELAKFLYYKKKIDGVRSLIGGVMKEYRKTGVIAALYHQTALNAYKLGYKWCELGWNLEDNKLINDFDMAIGGEIYKKYRIYEMKL